MDNSVVLGKTANDEDVVLTYKQRRQGTYVIGVNGTGKSTVLGRIALADMQHPDRNGLCVIDPHGDLIDDILQRIPENRAEDVVLFDPSDRDHPFALNLFAQPLAADEVDLLASEIVSIFAKVFGANWGPRIEDVTRNLTITLLTRPATFTLNGEPWPAALDEIPALLRLERIAPGYEDKPYFKQRYQTYRELFYPALRQSGQLPIEEFWVWDYDTLTPRPRAELVSSVLNKVRRFLANPMMRNMLAQTESRLDLTRIMDEGKILLVKLSKGQLGDDNANFLGSLIVAKLAVAIFARANQPRHERRPFHIIVDEFQNFASSSFPTLLSEARKYSVHLVVAHQYRDQLRQWVQGATSNAGNFVVFRVSGEDADELAKEFDQSRHIPAREIVPIYLRAFNILMPQFKYFPGPNATAMQGPPNPEYESLHQNALVPIIQANKGKPTSDVWGHQYGNDITFIATGDSPPADDVFRHMSVLDKAERDFPSMVKSTGWYQAFSRNTDDARAYAWTRPKLPRLADAYRATANRLTQLPNYQATCRLLSGSQKHFEAEITSPDWEPVDSAREAQTGEITDSIVARTRKEYCRPRADVERELEERYSKRLQSIGLPPLETGQSLPEVDRYYEED